MLVLKGVSEEAFFRDCFDGFSEGAFEDVSDERCEGAFRFASAFGRAFPSEVF